MSETRLPPLNRRNLLGGAAATLAAAAAGPAAAQGRRGGSYADPYYLEDDELFGPDGRRYRRAAPPRDRFYDTQVQEDYYRDPYGGRPAGDPYGHYPHGSRARRPGEPGLAAEPRVPDTPLADGGFDYRRVYARVEGEPYPVPAFDYRRVKPEFLRREVAYRGREPAGSIVVDPRARLLYFVASDGRAVRYGVGVGRQGFSWSGTATVNSKQAWPDWYPPKEMIERDPKLARQLTELQSGIGMHGGPGNPLGARALYLWQGGKDTLYRIHGTTEPWTIGTSVSSGCIRMVNQDAIDLYGRAAVGAQVIVRG